MKMIEMPDFAPVWAQNQNPQHWFYTDRNKALINVAITLCQSYQKMRESGQNPPLYRIDPDELMDVVRKAGEAVANRFADKLANGIVRGMNDQGVKLLSPPWNGYSYELKIIGQGMGGYRMFGNSVEVDDRAIIVFTKFGDHIK